MNQSATDKKNIIPWLAEINLLSVALFWGINMPIMKFALGRIDEYLFNALRLTLSAVVLGICWWFQMKSQNPSPPSGNSRLRRFIYIGLFALMTGFAYQVLFLLGIDSTSAGNTALIMSTIPMWTAILSLLMLREGLSQGAWTGLTIAFLGTIVVTLSKPAANGIGDNSLFGNLLVCAAAFSWAFGSVVSRPIMKTTSPVALAFFSIAGTVPLHWLVARHGWSDVAAVFSDGWLVAALLYSGVFSTGLAYAMWNHGVKHLGAAHAAGFQNLVPLIALMASWLLISEVPFPLQIAGGVLIIAGLVVMRKFPSSKKPDTIVEIASSDGK